MENRRNFHFQQSTTRPNTLKESQERDSERETEAERESKSSWESLLSNTEKRCEMCDAIFAKANENI